MSAVINSLAGSAGFDAMHYMGSAKHFDTQFFRHVISSDRTMKFVVPFLACSAREPPGGGVIVATDTFYILRIYYNRACYPHRAGCGGA